MKILVGSLALALSGSVFAAAVSNDSSQNILVSVPEVALLDVSEAGTGAARFDCTTTGAGSNFVCAGTNAIASYAITANLAAGTVSPASVPRVMTAKLATAISPTWTLDVTTVVTSGSAGALAGTTAGTVNLSATAANVVTAISNVAAGGAESGRFTYRLAPTNAGIAMAYSNDGANDDTLVVTYTLGDDA